MNELEQAFDRILHWLTKSGIRTEKGGYRSEYDCVSKRYISWGDGDDCSLSTAGAILVLLKCGLNEHLAAESGEHLLSLAIKTAGSSLEGAIPAGQNSDIINSYYQAISIQAFCELYRQLGDDRFVEGAVRSGLFTIRNLQTPDGYLRSHLLVRKNMRNRIRHIRSLCVETQTWLAEYARTFLELYDVTGAERWIKAANRLVEWLSKIQNHDGSFYKSRLSSLGRFLHSGRSLNPASLFNGWERRIHPTSVTSSLGAFILCERVAEAERSRRWLRNNLTPYGLFHENYSPKRNTVLDVMPSAQYGLILSRHLRHLPESIELMRRIARGIVGEQVSSDDRNADGGIIGLPGDASKGHSALSWDTEYSALYIAELLSSKQLRNPSIWLASE